MNRNHDVFFTSYFGCCLFAFLHSLQDKKRKKMYYGIYVQLLNCPPKSVLGLILIRFKRCKKS
jgi:hypothetical protein